MSIGVDLNVEMYGLPRSRTIVDLFGAIARRVLSGIVWQLVPKITPLLASLNAVSGTELFSMSAEIHHCKLADPSLKP